ncbi:hypothetical protein Prudu_020414, partial [Prunus dulcis]
CLGVLQQIPILALRIEPRERERERARELAPNSSDSKAKMADPPPPPLPPKELPINRYKFIWRVLLISNLALGAYMFIGARKRDIGIVNRKSAETGAKNHKAVVEVPSLLQQLLQVQLLRRGICEGAAACLSLETGNNNISSRR